MTHHLTLLGDSILDNTRYTTPAQARLALVPLALFNGRIIRTATSLGVDVLDLRSVCTELNDCVMEIEPSAQGARKIAGAIAGVIKESGAIPGV